MNVGGGEAADQLVRMMLTGGEITIRLGGDALKNLLALTMALAKNHKKLYGKVNMRKMLNETRDVRVFTMTPEQYKQFRKLAGKQKILFSAIKDADGHGLVDVVLPVTEIERANMIFERIKYNGKPEHPPQPEQAEQPESPNQSERPEQAEQSNQPEQPEQSEQFDQPEQPEQAEQPESLNQSEQPEQFDQLEQSQQPEQTSLPELLDQLEQPQQPEQVEQSELQRPEPVTPEGRDAGQEPQDLPLPEQREKTVSETRDEFRSQPDSPDTRASSDTPRDQGASKMTTSNRRNKNSRTSVEGRLREYQTQIQRKASTPVRRKTKSKIRMKSRSNRR